MFVNSKINKIVLLSSLAISTGFDVLNINIAGASFRLSYLFYLIVFSFLFQEIKTKKSLNIFLYFFLIIGIISIYQSHHAIKSILYIFWILFSYIVIFGIFSVLTKKYPEYMYQSILYSFRTQVLISLILLILGLDVDGRVSLFYYEPSYFAVASIIYVSLIFIQYINFGIKKILLDIFFLLIEIYTTKSATLIISIVIVLIVGYLLSGFTIKRFTSMLTFIILGLGFSYIYAHFGDDLVANTLEQIYKSENPLLYLINRGGNRIPRLTCAWDVFINNPWSGVGIGAYEYYTNTINISYCSKGMIWLSAENKPAINIFVEILATTGIFGAVFFIGFLLKLVCIKKIKNLNYIQLSYLTAIISMIIMLNFESNYLRPYFWMVLGIYFGSVTNYENKFYEKNHFN